MTIDAELNKKFQFDIDLNKILPDLLRLRKKARNLTYSFHNIHINGPKAQTGSNLCS